MLTVTKTVTNGEGFEHTSTTKYGSVSDTDKKVLTALELGEAAGIERMASLGIESIGSDQMQEAKDTAPTATA